ncbi:MAG: TonB-dependent receptor plug domain-containing protein, partial [Gammaproteobacteria bacterium]
MSSVFADPTEEDIEQVFGRDERMVNIATGYAKPIAAAPAITTVVTAKDIEAIGAKTLDQVLETVPGIHVSTARGIVPIASMRGLSSELNPHTLVMINGIPVAQSFTNNFNPFYALPTNNIARVEIIRGPGSALYGADAFAGAINVITKTTEGLRGTELGGIAGEFDTYEGWLLHGVRIGNADIALGLTGQATDGHTGIIAADAQTAIDRILGTSASLAPTRINTDRDIIDLRLDASLRPLRFRAGYYSYVTGTGTGLINALDPGGTIGLSQFSSDLTYDARLSSDWDLTAQASFFETFNEADTTILPAGAGGGLFPDGVLNDLEFLERQIRTEIASTYSGITGHILRGGIGFYHTALDDIEERRNLLLGLGGMLIPTGVFADTRVLGVEASLPEVDRDVYYGFLQDEWRFARDWSVTAGVRIDAYSDTGVTGNPRLSLVWNATPAITAKLLYGRAFRAPSFLEQFSRNNLLAIGNSDLDPEEIDTVEFALNYASGDIYAGINVFGYEIHAPIALLPNAVGQLVFDNAEDTDGHGLELESTWQATDRLRFKGHYAYQSGEGVTNTLTLSPTHQVYAEARWELMPSWFADLNLKAVIDRERVDTDPRSEIEDYTVVNLSLRRKNIGGLLDVAITVGNLFDVDAREPSLSAITLPN